MPFFNILRRWIDRSAKNDLVYRWFWNPLLRLTNLAERTRNRFDLDEDFGSSVSVTSIAKDLVVRSGPFKGMMYPHAAALGSAIYPKLLGTYEAELHCYLDRLISYEPSVVVDIGCAEGYYAVGLALRLPNCVVHAIDTDRSALKQCAEMAEANGVLDRVVFKDHCLRSDLDALENMNALIICDCEGYERVLFDDKIALRLRNSALVIETHDFRFPSITKSLRRTFAVTHTLNMVCSVSDFCRPQVFGGELLKGLDLIDQIAVMAEDRPAESWWLVCTPRAFNKSNDFS